MTGRTAAGALETVRVVPEDEPGRQLCVRCHTGEVGHGSHHRARSLLRESGGSGEPVSRAVRERQVPVRMSTTGDQDLRQSLVAGCRELARRGLTPGMSGNVSVRRDPRGFFVSPTGMPYDALDAADIPLVTFDGHWFGRSRPSSEWRFHRDILASRGEVGAIVHTHSPKATALACTARAIPAFHYMVAVAGGADIRCAPYHIFGSQALSHAALAALEGGAHACSPITE